jgi:hypothetical protein
MGCLMDPISSVLDTDDPAILNSVPASAKFKTAPDPLDMAVTTSSLLLTTLLPHYPITRRTRQLEDLAFKHKRSLTQIVHDDY